MRPPRRRGFPAEYRPWCGSRVQLPKRGSSRRRAEDFIMILPLTPIRFLERASRLYGGKEGVICRSLRITFAQFFERCRRLAGALLALGLKSGERVALLSYNCHRLLEAYYGVLQAQG